MCASRSRRGTEDLWVRLKDVVSHMVERLKEPESRFHASLVTNVFELVDLLPRLNVNQDEELNRFAEEIKDRLCGFTARDLKKNEILRVATANDAAQILTEMDAVLREREQSSGSDVSGECRQRRGHLQPHVSLHGGSGVMNHTTTTNPERGSHSESPDHAASRSSVLRNVLFRLGAKPSRSSRRWPQMDFSVLQPGVCRDTQCRGIGGRSGPRGHASRLAAPHAAAATGTRHDGTWPATMPSTRCCSMPA